MSLLLLQWLKLMVGLDQDTSNINKTYIQVNKTNNQVICDHTTFLKNTFNAEVDEESNKLPDIY